MSADSLLAGKCRHLVPLERRCSRCVHEAEANVLLAQLSPFARKKTGNQVSVTLPLGLVQNLVEHLAGGR